jgi:hypothetical protein
MRFHLAVLSQYLDMVNFPAILDLGLCTDNATIGLPSDLLDSLRKALAIALSDLEGPVCSTVLCKHRHGCQAKKYKDKRKATQRFIPVIGAADKSRLSAVQLQ